MGAAGVAERLAEMLGAPALLSRFSRLLIDPNRGLDDPTLIMQISDGLVVPGNVSLSESEVAARIARYYQPYHRAIEAAVDAAIAAGKPPVIISVHSFTQAWKGVPRPVVGRGAVGQGPATCAATARRPCAPSPASRLATTRLIRASSRAIRCIATARARARACSD